MDVEKMFQEMSDLVNKNSTNRGSSLTKRAFVDMYNNISITFVENLLRNRNLDDIRYLQGLRNKKNMTKVKTETKHVFFEFPKDYLSIIDVEANASKSKCKLTLEYLKEIKPEEESIYYNDSNTEPDFRCGESLYCVYDKGVLIYKKGFEIDSAKLFYYKKPQKIEIKGFKKKNGSDSVNISPTDLPDNIILRIIDKMATDFARNQENTQQWQMFNKQTIKK